MTDPDDPFVSPPADALSNHGHPHMATQAVLGVANWITATFVVVMGDGFASGLFPRGAGVIFWILPIIGLIALFGFGIRVRIRHGWRGFIPGLFLGMFLTCLVPIGLFWMLCGPNGSRI